MAGIWLKFHLKIDNEYISADCNFNLCFEFLFNRNSTKALKDSNIFT